MMESPAYRVLNLSEHRVIARIRLEHAHHGGRENGKLPVTFRDFFEYGVRWESIAPAIRTAEALGWIRVTQRGIASTAAEFRIPTKFALTHLATDDAAKAVTNDWQRIKTVEEAEAIAKKARKSPANAKGAKKFSHYRNGSDPEYRNGSDHPGFITTETVALSNSETVARSIYRGGGGGRGGKSRRRAAQPEQACRYCGELACKSDLTEMHQGFFIHPACVEEWRDGRS
jgi:hypothetical protein